MTYWSAQSRAVGPGTLLYELHSHDVDRADGVVRRELRARASSPEELAVRALALGVDWSSVAGGTAL